MDSLITSGAVREMILVMPDASNKYLGSHYANSPVTGNWADFIGRELVEYIDLNYRSFRAAKSRGIAGHSMGGRGTLFIASKYPDTFGALYALSSGRMGFDSFPLFEDSTWLKLIALQAPQTPDRALLVPLGLSAAYSPNPDKPPYFVDLPVELSNGTVKRVDSVWQKWVAHDPITVVQANAANLRSLRAIYFDCGRADKLISANRLLSQVLSKLGIPHVFEEYDGNHGNKIRERLETKVLPLFSRVLIAN
jgi:enterochelin esterase-like enzyme